jgi:hypothetical protein
MVDAMTSRMLSVFAAAMIAGLVVYDPSAETQPGPEPIDFTHLNGQAAAALQSLRALQAQRIVPQVDDALTTPTR